MSNAIAGVSHDALNDPRFDGWWDPVDKLLGLFAFGGARVLITTPVPWDGSPNGRLALFEGLPTNTIGPVFMGVFTTLMPLGRSQVRSFPPRPS